MAEWEEVVEKIWWTSNAISYHLCLSLIGIFDCLRPAAKQLGGHVNVARVFG